MSSFTAFFLSVIGISLLVAIVASLFDWLHEQLLIRRGKIPEFIAEDLDSIKKIKDLGYRRVAINRFRKLIKHRGLTPQEEIEEFDRL